MNGIRTRKPRRHVSFTREFHAQAILQALYCLCGPNLPLIVALRNLTLQVASLDLIDLTRPATGLHGSASGVGSYFFGHDDYADITGKGGSVDVHRSARRAFVAVRFVPHIECRRVIKPYTSAENRVSGGRLAFSGNVLPRGWSNGMKLLQWRLSWKMKVKRSDADTLPIKSGVLDVPF